MPVLHLSGRAARLAGTLALAALLAGCLGDDEPPAISSVETAGGASTGQQKPSLDGSGVATVSWTPPTRRMDGSPLTNLAGYRIWFGPGPRDLAYTVRLTNPGLTRYVVERLGVGTWYFAVTAIDADGLESPRSNVASKVVP